MRIDPEKPNYIVHAYTNGYWSYWGCVSYSIEGAGTMLRGRLLCAKACNQDGSPQEAADGSVIYQYAEVLLVSNDIRVINNVQESGLSALKPRSEWPGPYPA